MKLGKLVLTVFTALIVTASVISVKPGIYGRLGDEDEGIYIEGFGDEDEGIYIEGFGDEDEGIYIEGLGDEDEGIYIEVINVQDAE